ncbi:4'-phosphopantetheinyl transferase family protein [Streptomyces sundarbansensis]
MPTRPPHTPAPAPAPPAPLALVRTTADILPLLDTVVLAPYEQDRAAQYPAGQQRDDYLAAHVLVRLCAARYLDVDPAVLVLGQHCTGCGGEDHGRPFLRGLPGIGVSLSHTRGAAAAAAGHGPVGVDVEDAAGAVFSPRVAARVLAPAELAAVHADPDPARAFLRLWVRKESLVKLGATTLGRLRRTDLTLSGTPAPGRTGAARWTGGHPAAGLPGDSRPLTGRKHTDPRPTPRESPANPRPAQGHSPVGPRPAAPEDFAAWQFSDWSTPDGRLIAAAAHTTPAIDGRSEPRSPVFAEPGERHA